MLEKRIFFDVFIGEKDVIFEYLPGENEIKKMATFRRKYIEHIELYNLSSQ
jgi:hypothetical protein